MLAGDVHHPDTTALDTKSSGIRVALEVHVNPEPLDRATSVDAHQLPAISGKSLDRHDRPERKHARVTGECPSRDWRRAGPREWWTARRQPVASRANLRAWTVRTESHLDDVTDCERNHECGGSGDQELRPAATGRVFS